MRRFWLIMSAVIALFFLIAVMLGGYNAEAAKPTKASCKSCHADFAKVLPQNHPSVKGGDLAACTSCHKPDMTGLAKKNGFSVKIHTAHLAPKGSLDCLACHKWVPGKSFGLVGQKESWGAPTKEDMDLMKQIFVTWAGSNYTDNLHAKAGMACLQCHGKTLPKPDTTVENSQCLTCHGPMEKLAQKSEPKDFKDRNPHKSHLGDIACTVCHKAHAESKTYCLDCHKKFNMKIPGAAAAKP
jgi:hypothetical protein